MGAEAESTLPDPEKLRLAREKYQKEFGPGKGINSERAIRAYGLFIEQKRAELEETPGAILARGYSCPWVVDPQQTERQYAGIYPYEFWHGLALIAFTHGRKRVDRFFGIQGGKIEYQHRITHAEVCELMTYFIGEEAIPVSNLIRQAKAARQIILEAFNS